MTRATPTHDGTETDRALSRLVGLVVVVASIVIGLAVTFTIGFDITPGHLLQMGFLAFLFVVASLIQAHVRIRSTNYGFSWSDVAAFIAVVLLPVQLALLVVFAGALITKLIQRTAPIKVAFGAAKETVNAGAAVLVLLMFGITNALPPKEPINDPAELIPYALAYLAAMIADEVTSIPVLALATRSKMSEIFLLNLDIRLAFRLIRFGLSALAVIVLQHGWPLA